MSLQSSTISSLKEIKDPGEIREKIDAITGKRM